MAKENDCVVTKEDGEELAESLDVDGYVECSALSRVNLSATITFVVDHWRANRGRKRQQKKKASGGGLFGLLFGGGDGSRSSSSSANYRFPPRRAPKPKTPDIIVQTETFSNDLLSMVANPFASDVDFYVQNEIIPAHRVLLCMGRYATIIIVLI